MSRYFLLSVQTVGKLYNYLPTVSGQILVGEMVKRKNGLNFS